MSDRDEFVRYLEHFIGTVYKWGGDDPMEGLDCSGLAVEGLQAFGKIRHGSDYVADGLFRVAFPTKRISVEQGKTTRGALVGYQDSTGKVIHVEVSRGDGTVVGAIGGGAKTLTPGDAVASNAFVKIRPIGYRGQPTIACDPWA